MRRCEKACKELFWEKEEAINVLGKSGRHNSVYGQTLLLCLWSNLGFSYEDYYPCQVFHFLFLVIFQSLFQ